MKKTKGEDAPKDAITSEEDKIYDKILGIKIEPLKAGGSIKAGKLKKKLEKKEKE